MLNFYTNIHPQIYIQEYSLQFMKDLFMSVLSITTKTNGTKEELLTVTVYWVLL